MNKRKKSIRILSAIIALVMVFTTLPQSAFATSGDKVVKGTSDVFFGGEKAYDANAEVSISDGVIKEVVFSHNAASNHHEASVSYAEDAKAMSKGFIGKNITDRAGIEAVDGVTGATITSDAYRKALMNALGYKDTVKDFTFGSGNKELKPGEYVLPVKLRNADRHSKPSNAAAAFPATAILNVDAEGHAVLTSEMKPVTIGPVTDMAYNVKYYKEDNYNGKAENVNVLETTEKPEGMPEAGKTVPTKISFQIPNNDFDGVYLNFTVDAMGPAYPDAWLELDYANAKVPGNTEHIKSSAKVNQFGKYTIYTDISVRDGVITNVDIEARDFISETHKPTNIEKTNQVAKALKSAWNGIAPTQENAETVFKTIMSKTNPDYVIDSVSGATYSAKAARDAVMSAFNLKYQDEVINVPENVEPGVYEVEAGYYSDVVWHSLVENVKTKAILTVNNDKTMSLEMDLKSGTEREPLYVLGFNGVYPDNDKSKKLTMDECSYKKGLSSNDYEDEFFAKGTQVVNHVKFPLLGGLSKTYTTNAYLYVPAMKRLNGELSGVYFEDGKFNVDIFAKIYWDGMKKIGDVEEHYNATATMKHEYKDENSMCDIMFDKNAEITVKGDEATVKLLVANPVPGFSEEGKDGTVKNVVVNYDGKQYTAESQLGTDAKMTAKATNPTFGFVEGKQYAAQVLTFTLPKEAVHEGAMLVTNAYVNVVMDTDVVFRINLTDITKAEEKEEITDVTFSKYFPRVNDTTYKYRSRGKHVNANPVVKDANGNVLVKDTDYTVVYSDENRVLPGKYTVTVKGMGDYTGTVEKTLVITPKAVDGVNVRQSTATGGYDDAYVTWSKSEGADGYQVYARRPGRTDWAYIGRTTGTSFLEKDLYDGWKYEFKVVPYEVVDGTRFRSLDNYDIVSMYTMKKVSTPSVKKYSSTRVQVSWNNISGESGYQLMASRSGKTTYFRTTSTSYKFSVAKGKKYTYKVRAYKNVTKNGKTYRVYAPWSNARTYTLR